MSTSRARAISMYAIQRGLASGANEYLRFGRLEGAIAHFHSTLCAALAQTAR